jgi:hypothetical protein
MNFERFDDRTPVEPGAAALAGTRGRAARRRARRRAATGAIAVAIVIAIVVPAGFNLSRDRGTDDAVLVGQGQDPDASRGVVATIRPDASVVQAGEPITGTIRFHNHTSTEVTLYRCTLAYHVVAYGPHEDFHGRRRSSNDQCRAPLALPPGITDEAFSVPTVYSSCGDDPTQGFATTCLPGGEPPPYPPGAYRLALDGPEREEFDIRGSVLVTVVRGDAPPGIADLETSIEPVTATVAAGGAMSTRWIVSNPTDAPVELQCLLDDGVAVLTLLGGPGEPRTQIGRWSTACRGEGAAVPPGGRAELAGPVLSVPGSTAGGDPIVGGYWVVVTLSAPGVRQPEPFQITVTDPG